MFTGVSAFSLVYKKEFLPSRSERTIQLKYSLITNEDIKWAKFVTPSVSSAQFAVNQFEKSLDDVLSLAIYAGDMKYTKILRETIRVLSLEYKNGKNKTFLILKKLIKERFSKNPNYNEIMEFLVRENKKNPLTDNRKILSYYRKILPKLWKLAFHSSPPKVS